MVVFAQPGEYEVTFLVDADGFIAESDESNNSTSVKVTAGFDCVRGPNGGCNGVADPVRTAWNPTRLEYLMFLEGLAKGGSATVGTVTCAKGLADARSEAAVLACLSQLADESVPELGVILDSYGCRKRRDPDSCISAVFSVPSALITRIRQAADKNPALKAYLDQPL